MSTSVSIALVACFIVALQFLWTLRQVKPRQLQERVAWLEKEMEERDKRIARLERNLSDCERLRRDLMSENVDLMRRLVSDKQ